MNYCNNCGNKIQSEQKFCSKCGQTLKLETKKEFTNTETKTEISSKWISKGLDIFAIFLFLVLVYDGITMFEQMERLEDKKNNLQSENYGLTSKIWETPHNKCKLGIIELHNVGLTSDRITELARNNEIRTTYND